MSARQALATLLIGIAFMVCFLCPLWLAKAFAACGHSHRCWHRVSIARHVRAAWRYYHHHPLPACTWERESGWPGLSQWAPRRYRARNSQSTAGGKYQMLDQSAHAAGVPNYHGDHDAAQAPPLIQEKAARVLYRMQGPHAWVNC